MKKSTSKVEIVPVKLEPHPNADKLSVVKVFGYSVVVRSEDWAEGDLGAYVPPDMLVPNIPTFEWLFDGKRSQYNVHPEDGTAIKAKDGAYSRITFARLRKVLSHGLLVPAPEGMKVGDDAAEYFGVRRYEPTPTISTYGMTEAPPPGIFAPKYDVDALMRYADKFVPGEPVSVSEKIHGANGRWVYAPDKDGNLRMWAASHNQWKKKTEKDLWWQALENEPEVETFCKANPGVVVYGEVYGPVQKLRYGKTKPHIAVFDILKDGEWVNVKEARETTPRLPWVPLLVEKTPFDLAELTELADGNSLIPDAGHIREGIVIKPLVERYDDEIGRVQLKLVSDNYLKKDSK